MRDNGTQSLGPQNGSGLRRYVRPQLTRLGALSDVTLGKPGTRVDGNSGNTGNEGQGGGGVTSTTFTP